MAGDYSRKRFNSENHYQGVLRQQGRVDLDADWNEYVDLQDRRWRAESIDVIGRCGVPSETPDGFKIQNSGNQFTIGQGRIYVDGLLAENHGATPEFNATLEENYGTAIPVVEQPYSINTVDVTNNSVVYLDVWRREVTHLQAPLLIEPAVNVDTTTRYQTAWQVKAMELTGSVTCQTPLPSLPGWPAQNLPSAARLTTSIVAVSSESAPCLVPPTGGYRGLENHLYRVEVHDVGSSGEVRVKWSRENAHVATNVLQILDGLGGVKVESLGRDDVLRFKPDDWVEITNDPCEFLGKAGIMRRISTVDDTNQTLTFSEALPTTDFQAGPVAVAEHWRVIRWDQSGSGLTSDGLIELTAANPSFILEHGIEVNMSGLTEAHIGDYWCFAARTADADIERLDKAPPLGIHHHFCKLAIIDSNGVIQDCRPVFPALTELTSLFYVSGDGQEALPDQALPKPIQVGVANGKRPVVGAQVSFRVTGGGGTLTAATASGLNITVVTDALGIASCSWKLGTSAPSQQVEAKLADGSHLPVRFNAVLSKPGGDEPGVHVREISVGGQPLGNDTEVTVAELASGITITCDESLFHGSLFNKPVCFVTLEMPFPFNSADRNLWGDAVIGYQPLILAGSTNSQLELIFWQAMPDTEAWLVNQLFKLLKDHKRGERVLARLTLKGNFIWSERNPNLYVDGEVFGVTASGGAITAVKLPSGDNRRGGDLEMWFWLIEQKGADVTVRIDPDKATAIPGGEVEFTVTVEGTTDKTVQMVLMPPKAGTITSSKDKPQIWTYKAPATPQVEQVKVIARSNADPTEFATAVVTIPGGDQDVEVNITFPKLQVEVGEQLDFTVTVKGGDVTKIEMRVNDIVNGDAKVGTLEPAPEKGAGKWIYAAPETVPSPPKVKITATSQEDKIKPATAELEIIAPKPRSESGGSGPTTGGTGTGSGGGEAGSRPRRPRRPRT